MSSEIENNEAVEAMLLMYLVNELSPTDQQEVERKLNADPALQARLERMRAAHEAYLGALRAVDSAGGRTISHEAASARVCRLIRQWSGNRAMRAPALMKKKEMRVPWWSYPLVAAAAVLVAVVFWGLKHHELDMTNGQPPQSIASDGNPSPDQTPAPAVVDTSVSSALAELTPDQQENLLNAFGRSTSGQAGPAEDATDVAVTSVAPDQNDAGNGALGGADDLDNLLLGGDLTPKSLKETR